MLGLVGISAVGIAVGFLFFRRARRNFRCVRLASSGPKPTLSFLYLAVAIFLDAMVGIWFIAIGLLGMAMLVRYLLDWLT